jgi:hypothetical protein
MPIAATPHSHRRAGRRVFASGASDGSPLGWEHVDLTGDYIWAAADEGIGRNQPNDGFRALRSAPKANLLAA